MTFLKVTFAQFLEELYADHTDAMRSLFSGFFSREATSSEILVFDQCDAFESEKRWWQERDMRVLSSGTFVAVVYSSNKMHYYVGKQE